MLRLARLPRARRCESISVRGTAPGHAGPRRPIDPAHPAARRPFRSLPAVVCPHFTVRAIPDAVLHEPVDFVPVNPLLATARARRTPGPVPSSDASRRQLSDARVAALARRGRRTVNLLFHTSKKATSKSSVVRRRLRTKMTAAITLVVGRHADADHSPRLVLVSRPTSEPLVLQGWTYLVTPDLAVYKTPLPILVQAIRKALLSLSQQSRRLEASWSALRRTSVDSRHTPPRRPPTESHSGKPVVDK